MGLRVTISITFFPPPQRHCGNQEGQMQSLENFRKASFTTLCSREWKEMTPRRPPFLREEGTFSRV